LLKLSTLALLAFYSEDSPMFVFTEKIAPPPPEAGLDDEAIRKLAEQLEDDRWVKNMIDALGGILRDSRN
jgi:hypothetical protein